jgi:FtsP/CotA-like multicopper oxidase with cupredoxin domain
MVDPKLTVSDGEELMRDDTGVVGTGGGEPGAATVSVDLEARTTDWEIQPGHTVRGYGFNGMVPGPTIEAKQGDTLVVRLTNHLPEPTSIHWHGLRVPADMDGTELVQHPVQPGQRFEYRFRLPDAGTFWYHPHRNEPEQLERGLYAALVVRGPDEPRLDGERVLLLDDLKLDRGGQIARFGGPIQRAGGRQGKTRLVNGMVEPELKIAAGQVQRWRLVNAASARYVRLSIGGRRFKLLGSDGGLLPAPVDATDVLLTPGDRVDLAVGPFEEGETLAIESLPYNRGAGRARTERFATLHVGAPAPSLAAIPADLRHIEPLASRDATPTRTIRLGTRLSLRHGVDWLVDDEAHHQDDPVPVGELQVWEVINETRMDHPFHLHGFSFQVLQENGTPTPALSWEDTVNVPAKGRVRIAWLPDDRPGKWMYHCHILEHHAAGMMGNFEVVRRHQP